jgi:hypothetical protein
VSFVADAALVESIDAATAEWRQGDIIDLRAIGWLALVDAPLTEHPSAASATEDSNVAYVFAEVEALVVVSQTCDVIRGCSSRPHVELAGLVRLEEPVAGEARRGSRPRFVPVPGAGGDAFADLDVIVTAEKSLLARLDRVEGLPTETDQRRFGRGVGRVYSRFAFPDDLSFALAPLVERVRAKHDRDSDEGRALAALEEIRVTGTPSWSGDEVDVFLTFAPATRAEALAVLSEEDWDGVVDGWLRRADSQGVVRSVDGAMVPLDELSAREYVDSDPLDLDYLSWAPSGSTRR